MSWVHFLQCRKSREFITEIQAFPVSCQYGTETERESGKKDEVGEHYHHSR